jgi:Uncharacterised nucleotidyltransferase
VGFATEFWTAVGALVDRASVDGVVAHKLAPLAAGRRRAAGDPVPEAFAVEERAASFAAVSAVALLGRIRELGDGPLVLLKGPEVAALYPPNGRRFGDIDVLTPDAPALHRALREHGFVDVYATGYEPLEHHHLPPLRWPVVPLAVEVHAMPNWPRGMKRPPLAEILEAAEPSVVGVEGISAPRRLHHALLLAAHAWSHVPLQTLRDLVDVAALAAGEERAELDRLAAAWDIRRIWRTTRQAMDALFSGGPRPAALRIWARHLNAVRERTVFEDHLQAALHPFWGRPLATALIESLAAVRTDLVPAPGESWRTKLQRIPRAVRDARMPLSQRPEATAEEISSGSTG